MWFHLRVVREFSELMFQSKEVPLLIRYELIQINQAIEEDANLIQILSQLIECKMAFSRCWLDHIIHLTQDVNKENRLVVEVLETMDLLLVEKVHLMRSDYSVVVQIYHFVPILQRP